MTLYVGDDWSEDHHDVQLMNEAGERLAARRLPEGVKGVAALHELIAQHASDPGEVVVGIETERGPWVSALLAAGYRVYAINPRSAARYRERHHVRHPLPWQRAGERGFNAHPVGFEASARLLRGAAPPTPPSRKSVRCAPLGPTHPPSGFLSVGAPPPRPRPDRPPTAARPSPALSPGRGRG